MHQFQPSAESDRKNLHAGIEEFDLELSISNWPRLRAAGMATPIETEMGSLFSARTRRVGQPGERLVVESVARAIGQRGRQYLGISLERCASAVSS